MDTATLTLANDDTVLLPAVHMAGRHRRPTLLARVRHYVAPEPVVTVVILLAVVLMAAGVVAAAVWPTFRAAGATWDPAPAAVAPVATVQCDTDASCAAYDYARGVQPAPVMDAGGVYTCPAGWEWAVVEADTSGQEEDDGHNVECLPSGYVDGQRWT